MKVKDLILILRRFPPDAKVIMADDMGASEIEESSISMETMNYIEYTPSWPHHPPYYGWEYPSEYKRNIVSTEEAVVIR